jgi:hypothetical protein
MRIVPLAHSVVNPRACNTWLGSVLSDEQAAPLLTANPSESKATTSDSPSMPRKLRLKI